MPGPPAHPPPTRSPLTIGSRDDPDGVTLVLRGEIYLASAPALERELQDAESLLPRHIVLDLAGLDFIDSTGIHALIDAQQRAQTTATNSSSHTAPPTPCASSPSPGVNARLDIE